MKEKLLQRESFNKEVDRLNSEIQTQSLKQSVLERDRQREYAEYTDGLSRVNYSHSEFADQ